jgi:hypothetical protein
VSTRPYKPTYAQLAAALAPLVKAYEASIDPGHSDLDNEQPHCLHEVRAELGDFRKAASLYHWLQRQEDARVRMNAEAAA